MLRNFTYSAHKTDRKIHILCARRINIFRLLSFEFPLWRSRNIAENVKMPAFAIIPSSKLLFMVNSPCGKLPFRIEKSIFRAFNQSENSKFSVRPSTIETFPMLNYRDRLESAYFLEYCEFWGRLFIICSILLSSVSDVSYWMPRGWLFLNLLSVLFFPRCDTSTFYHFRNVADKTESVIECDK